MIPKNSDDLVTFVIEEQPSKSYALDFAAGRVRGETDGLDAIKQAIYLILNVERYENIIYSWDYGIELRELIGEPPPYALPEIKRIVAEALMQDNRIKSVDGFNFETIKGKVHATFTVHTVLGEINVETEITI